MSAAAWPAPSSGPMVSGPCVIASATEPSIAPVATARRTSRSVTIPTRRSPPHTPPPPPPAPPPAPPPVHPPGGVEEARRGIEPEDVPGHDLPDGGHEAIV